jgi:hypothetical protein
MVVVVIQAGAPEKQEFLHSGRRKSGIVLADSTRELLEGQVLYGVPILISIPDNRCQVAYSA